MTINVIDTHAHIVLGKAFGKAGKYGPDTGLDEKWSSIFSNWFIQNEAYAI